MNKKLKIIIANLLLLPFVAVVIYGFSPVWTALEQTFVEKGVKKERRIQNHSNDVLDRLVADQLDRLGKEPTPYYIQTFDSHFFQTEGSTELLIAKCAKKVEGGYDYEGDATAAAFDDGTFAERYKQKYENQSEKLRIALANYRTKFEKAVGVEAMFVAEKAYDQNLALHEQTYDRLFGEGWIVRWGRVLLAILIGILWMIPIMTIYALIRAKIFGMKAWIELITGRAILVGATWLLTVLKYPSCKPEDQLVTSLKFAAGWIVLLLSAAPAVFSQAGGGQNSKNGKQGYAWVMDLRTSATEDEGFATFTRITGTGPRFLFENVTTTNQTPIAQTIANDFTPGVKLLKKKGWTINVVGGYRITYTKTTDGNATTGHRILFGTQAFFNNSKFSVNVPLCRFEKPIFTEGQRFTFGFGHAVLYKINSKWGVGEETTVVKSWSRPTFLNTGPIVRFKPGDRWPIIEGGFFYNPTTEHHTLRGRAIFNW